ncbi:MAG: RnfABCDGE type electron transport complex subunit D [Treponemataceae bacterium]|nr:MAG: RnfABCDGE type electron transport complex subunit D [Treponemataceae bacterium]
MSFDPKNIYLSPAPHFSHDEKTSSIMLTVIVALLPLCASGVYYFGARALITIAVSIISCIVFECVFRKITKQDVRIKDFSAVVTGMLMALVLPPSTPIWMTVLGALFAIVVAKEFFGGLGANVFNPALSGRAFLFVSFPTALTTWSNPFDTLTSATILPKIQEGGYVAEKADYFAYFVGSRAGCIGETSIMFILLAFILLLVLKIIDWRAPLAMVAVFAGATAIAGGDVLLNVLSGGLLFGAVFMVTDYATTPVTKAGRLIFGAGCGLITFLIRQFGGYPEGVMFSILIMNILAPFLNTIIPRKYGQVKKAKGAK